MLAMSKLSKIAVTLLLLAGFGVALFFSLRGQKAEVAQQPSPQDREMLRELKRLRQRAQAPEVPPAVKKA